MMLGEVSLPQTVSPAAFEGHYETSTNSSLYMLDRVATQLSVHRRPRHPSLPKGQNIAYFLKAYASYKTPLFLKNRIAQQWLTLSAGLQLIVDVQGNPALDGQRLNDDDSGASSGAYFATLQGHA